MDPQFHEQAGEVWRTMLLPDATIIAWDENENSIQKPQNGK
jgi:hypothetical protein